MKNSHSQHRQRVKQEFRDNGLEHFPDHKVLEMLLFYTIPQKDTNPIAHRLIERFGSFSSVFEAPYDLLLAEEGIGPETATYIKALSAYVKRYMIDTYAERNYLKTSGEIKEYIRYRFLSDIVEKVLLVCLGPGKKIVYSGTIAEGTLEQVEIIPANLIKISLRANAVQAILAHNHPGGFCNPSRKDLNTTFILYEELKRVDVELIDHMIVAADGIYSMQESGMFPRSL